MSESQSPNAPPLLRTPLHALHVELGARMVAFAGYEMPVNYPAGILAEHLHTRAAAGLFDVSHMGQAHLDGPDHATVALALERLCAADILNLAPGRQRYAQFLNEEGGVVDDLMVTRPFGADGCLILVVNAARKGVDFELLRAKLPPEVRLTTLDALALIALQGPHAANALARIAPAEDIATMPFMSARALRLPDGVEAHVSRSGYTGEDGFEVSLASEQAETFARRLLSDSQVKPIGLGARDSLRLEAGLCLYGHELDETIDPVEAGLTWSIQKRRRIEGGFPGAARIQAALANGPARKRVGLRLEGRAPAREGAEIVNEAGAVIGRVTSGGFGPSVGAPIAMGYAPAEATAPGTPVGLVVRGKTLAARIADLPFHPHAYYRGQ
jgi:glycine cleavage system T protein (aminomethyltransferase)